jgi:hypothetical protein
MNLRTAQIDKLYHVLASAHLELKWTRQTRSDRAFDRSRRARIDEAMGVLIGRLGPDVDRAQVLPVKAREVIGLVTSRAMIRAVMRRSTGLTQVEWDPRAASHLHAGRILRAVLELVRSELRDPSDQGSSDRGGREPNYVCRHLIRTLAEASPDVLGQPATATAGGAFMQLVAEIFTACDLSQRGLEQAVQRELARLPSP